MTTYHKHGVTLSEGQKKRLAKAIKDRSEITLRLSSSELNGSDDLRLTRTQINRLKKAGSQGKGSDLKLSKIQIRHMIQKGDSLITTLMSLGTRALPYATNFASKVLPGLATGALSSLGNFVMDKILGQGQGQIGGFMIPQNKIDQLIAHKNLLTKKQKEQIIAAIQTGGKLVIKPTTKQHGGLLGSILASIGIPMLLNSILGKGLQNRRPTNTYLAPYRPPPFIGQWDTGKGLQNRRPTNTYLAPYRPPPTLPPTIPSTRGKGVKKRRQKAKVCCWGQTLPSRTSHY